MTGHEIMLLTRFSAGRTTSNCSTHQNQPCLMTSSQSKHKSSSSPYFKANEQPRSNQNHQSPASTCQAYYPDMNSSHPTVYWVGRPLWINGFQGWKGYKVP